VASFHLVVSIQPCDSSSSSFTLDAVKKTMFLSDSKSKGVIRKPISVDDLQQAIEKFRQG
jgi:hypothetical protein